MHASKNLQYLVYQLWQQIGKRCAEVSETDIMFALCGEVGRRKVCRGGTRGL